MNEIMMRIARAIDGERMAMIDHLAEKGDSATGPLLLCEKLRVLAVIRAIREPTARMRREGESMASFGIAKPTDDNAIVEVWQAMVDAMVVEG